MVRLWPRSRYWRLMYRHVVHCGRCMNSPSVLAQRKAHATDPPRAMMSSERTVKQSVFRERAAKYHQVSQYLSRLTQDSRPAYELPRLLSEMAGHGYPTLGRELGTLRNVMNTMEEDLELIRTSDHLDITSDRNVRFIFETCAGANDINLRFERRTFQNGVHSPPRQWFDIVKTSRKVLFMCLHNSKEVLRADPNKFFEWNDDTPSPFIKFLQRLSARRINDAEFASLLCKSFSVQYVNSCCLEDVLRLIYALRGLGISPNQAGGNSPLVLAKQEVETRVRKKNTSDMSEVEPDVLRLMSFPLLANALYALSSSKTPSFPLSYCVAQKMKELCSTERVSQMYALDKRSVSHLINSMCSAINAFGTAFKLKGDTSVREAVTTTFEFLSSSADWSVLKQTGENGLCPLSLGSVESFRKLLSACNSSNRVCAPLLVNKNGGVCPRTRGVTEQKDCSRLEPIASIISILNGRKIDTRKLTEFAKILGNLGIVYRSWGAVERLGSYEKLLSLLQRFQNAYRTHRSKDRLDDKISIEFYEGMVFLYRALPGFCDFASILRADQRSKETHS
eukprot:gb/GECG01012505.1/.p1 GENE.gb/GECG01012505.1/~~gb/GECG01012505.1/.p1  ORF type:complete len:564 (+),score=44.34 gb/GECG01012505.1/:1-1692(+)